ncbi:hypothetical protein M408DRAFT_270408 [Serendipita vermifera MAFF 305830]|uniref:Uncharacterized protein n=1 Tax=Serendipita vermifera MAFF 305830 TaxID=933852 RepID=A0A0C2XP98_SERVB|nr:hypothetical protein M408DRAFT_270408 [Serendipita vermifera MAFF 305830]
MLLQGPLGLEDLPNLKEEPFDALGLQGMSEFLNPAAFLLTPEYELSLLPPESPFPIIAPKAGNSLPESPNYALVSLPISQFEEACDSYNLWAGSIPTSTPPLSPEALGSPPSATDDSSSSHLSPLPSWTYDDFFQGIVYSPELVKTFHVAVDRICNREGPTKEQIAEFVRQRPGSKTFVCAVDTCDWHHKGWKREDRGIAHVRMEHFKVQVYMCPHWYVVVYLLDGLVLIPLLVIAATSGLMISRSTVC